MAAFQGAGGYSLARPGGELADIRICMVKSFLVSFIIRPDRWPAEARGHRTAAGGNLNAICAAGDQSASLHNYASPSSSETSASAALRSSYLATMGRAAANGPRRRRWTSRAPRSGQRVQVGVGMFVRVHVISCRVAVLATAPGVPDQGRTACSGLRAGTSVPARRTLITAASWRRSAGPWPRQAPRWPRQRPAWTGPPARGAPWCCSAARAATSPGGDLRRLE